jgi:hypothetical protein
MRTLSSNLINVTEYGGFFRCAGLRGANFTLGIMAALEDVAVFWRRFNLTRHLLILI